MTVNVFVPGSIPVTVVAIPEPVMAPGLMVQLPEGKPLNATLPDATAHVGCVTLPVIGAVGVSGCVLITMFTDAEEEHPAALVTV